MKRDFPRRSRTSAFDTLRPCATDTLLRVLKSSLCTGSCKSYSVQQARCAFYIGFLGSLSRDHGCCPCGSRALDFDRYGAFDTRICIRLNLVLLFVL